jgi:peptide deformylase
VLPVERANKVRVVYTALGGEQVTGDFSGYLARIIQHEVDHLDGITFIDRNKEIA